MTTTVYVCGYDDCPLHDLPRQVVEDDGPLGVDDPRRACPGCDRALDRLNEDGSTRHDPTERPPAPPEPTPEEIAAQEAEEAAARLADARTRRCAELADAFDVSDKRLLRSMVEDGKADQNLIAHREELRELRSQVMAAPDVETVMAVEIPDPPNWTPK